MSGLTIYGHYVSQPTRAVLWALAIKQVPHKFVKIDPIAGDAEKDEFLRKFPSGLIPAMEDDGFKLSESQAMLCYLADKHGWDDWYPKDLQQRAVVNQWLHWHHGALRPATLHFFRPLMQTTLGSGKFDLAVENKRGLRILKDSFATMKYGALTKHDYLAGQHLSIADIAAYCELDQLAAMKMIPDLFAANPEVVAWMARMKQLPHHDDVRRALNKLVGMLSAAPKL